LAKKFLFLNHKKKEVLKVRKLILVLVLSVFVVGLGAGSAMADSIMFPWVVKNSTDVFTLVSVVNTSETNNTACLDPQLHYQYFWKNAESVTVNTDICTEQNFYRSTSVNDIVSFDAAGVVNTGSSLFNDQPPRNGEVAYIPNSFDMDSSSSKARAFLIVDNNNTTCFDDATSASLYGEAMVIQISQGAAWGYVAFNGLGGGPNGPADEPQLGFNDDLDMQGEVLRSPRYYDEANTDGEELETAPVVLLPLDVFTTKMFVTPVNFSRWESDQDGAQHDPYSGGNGARTGDSNSRIQFCLDPMPVSNFPVTSPCPSGILGLEYEGESCQSNSAGTCRQGGIYDNDEMPVSATIQANVVCTTALDIETANLLLSQAQIDYLNSGAQGWAYVRSMVGSFFGQGQLGTRDTRTMSDSIIGKLDYTVGSTAIGNVTIPGSVNDFKWVRNSGSLYDEEWDLLRGINAVGIDVWGDD
jgi:hypothetical protein